jgi:hypothetical protein
MNLMLAGGLLALGACVSAACASDSVSIGLLNMRIANNVNQTRSSSPNVINRAFKYYTDFSADTMVKGDSGLLAFTYPNPVPLATLMESFQTGSSAALHSVAANPGGTLPFIAAPQTFSGTSSGATLTMTIGAGIDASGVASFNITQVTIAPTLMGSMKFTSGTITISVGCLGDYNNDGGADGSDIQAFLLDWAAGGADADLNGDGGIDGGDVQTFFEHWEAGC